MTVRAAAEPPPYPATTPANAQKSWPLFLRIFTMMLATVLLVQILNFGAFLLMPPPSPTIFTTSRIAAVARSGRDASGLLTVRIADAPTIAVSNPRELLARIRSVLRRNQAAASAAPSSGRPYLRFAGWRLDPVGRQLFDPDQVVINLSDGEFRLLLAFAEHPRRVLTRDQLLDLSRGLNAEHFDRAIDVQVSRLRRKLRSRGDDIIRTIRNEGYFFVPRVVRL